MVLEVEQFICRSDNFGALVHDPATGATIIVDAPQEAPIVAAVERTGWEPTVLLVTHHHQDHVEANLALKRRYGLQILGPESEAAKIPGIDDTLVDGEAIRFGGEPIEVIETPGHTAGHVCYHMPASKLLFSGDTLFSLGCGRLFERGAADMLASLRKLAALPPDTVIHCGHDYTASNARFALTVDPDNPVLEARAKEVERLAAEGLPTLPTTLAAELAANPFLRWGDPAIRRTLGMEDASDEAVFAEIRKRKDVS